MKSKIHNLSYLLLQLAILSAVSYILIELAWEKPNEPLTITPQVQATTTIAASLVPQQDSSSVASSTPLPDTKPVPPTFSNLKLIAESAIVYDIDSGETLFSLRADDRLPIASLTKVMTALTASLVLPADTVITISAADAATESSGGIKTGERWPLKDLLAFTLVASSNGGANAIARAAEEEAQIDFVIQMNALAREIGLTHSYFRNPSGLDIYNEQLSGSYSSARDIARLFGYIEKNGLGFMRKTNQNSLSFSSLDNNFHQANNTNLLVAKIPNLLASKTGTTNLAGGCLGIVFQPTNGRRVAVVVLNSTINGRFEDMDKLVKATINELATAEES